MECALLELLGFTFLLVFDCSGNHLLLTHILPLIQPNKAISQALPIPAPIPPVPSLSQLLHNKPRQRINLRHPSKLPLGQLLQLLLQVEVTVKGLFLKFAVFLVDF